MSGVRLGGKVFADGNATDQGQADVENDGVWRVPVDTSQRVNRVRRS